MRIKHTSLFYQSVNWMHKSFSYWTQRLVKEQIKNILCADQNWMSWFGRISWLVWPENIFNLVQSCLLKYESTRVQHGWCFSQSWRLFALVANNTRQEIFAQVKCTSLFHHFMYQNAKKRLYNRPQNWSKKLVKNICGMVALSAFSLFIPFLENIFWN